MLVERDREIRARGRLLFAAAGLSDAELLGRVVDLARKESEATAELVAHLGELDARRLYLGEGFSSLFGYCTGALRLAEHAAYNRIEAARASRRFPAVLGLLADGSLNLSTLRLIAPHLRPENFDRVVSEAKGRSKREVEVLVAQLAPRSDVAASVRRLPAPAPRSGRAAGPAGSPPTALLAPPTSDLSPSDPSVSESRARSALALTVANDSALPSWAAAPDRAPTRPAVAALSPGRYRVQFTIGEQTHDRLRQAQELLRREIPDGDPGTIFDRALALLLEDVARKKTAATPKPRETTPGEGRGASSARRRSRHIPARVRRAVWRRDGGRCAFVAPNGHRCAERTFLELHHREPYAIGGEATVANISLRCRPHNAYEAVQALGSAGPAAVTLPVAPNGPRPQLAPGRVGHNREERHPLGSPSPGDTPAWTSPEVPTGT